jgi:hypothetical protein
MEKEGRKGVYKECLIGSDNILIVANINIPYLSA